LSYLIHPHFHNPHPAAVVRDTPESIEWLTKVWWQDATLFVYFTTLFVYLKLSIEWLTDGQVSPIRIIWPPSLPPTPSHISELDWRHAGRFRKRDKLLMGEVGGRGWGRNRRIIQKQESTAL
jgi:hypothetical protein